MGAGGYGGDDRPGRRGRILGLRAEKSGETALNKSKKLVSLSALLLSVLLISSVLFFICYQYDNKYTAKGPQALAGVLMLDSEKLEQWPVIYLVRDWEIYRGRLLEPEDFVNAPIFPDELVFIGQYGGFEGHIDSGARRSPHGSATYRLTIALPPEKRSYTLELPEIYSAYKLYINGELMTQMGEISPDNYRPQTGNGAVTVQAAGRMEILIAATDYSHFYSGMVYPPAFGEPSAVAKLLNTRLALRVLADAVAICVGLLSLYVWLLLRKEKDKSPNGSLPLYYAALCACFVLCTCYPIVKTLARSGMGWYPVENFAYCAMLLFVILIQRRLTDSDDRWFIPFGAFAVFVCCWSLSVPYLMGDSLNLMTAYSRLIGLYACISALYLTVSAALAVYRGAVYSEIMLAGVTVFDAALIMDRLLPMFEPMRFGWFTELAGGLLVLTAGLVMAADVAGQYRLRQAVENRAETVYRMLEVQRTYYLAIQEKEQEVRAARHDLRHQITVIRQLVSDGDAEKLKKYINAFEDRSVKPIQENYCKHYIANMLLRMYAGLAQQQETALHVRAYLPETISVDDIDLCVILSNLLENALEASVRIPPKQRSVSVNIGLELDRLGILIKNRFNGYLRVKNDRFLSAKQTGREGIGLASVRAICKNYGGSADFYADESGVFHSEIILSAKSEESDPSQRKEGDA